MRLHSYMTKAEQVCSWPFFRGDALVYGVEVEVEPRSNASQSRVLRGLGEDQRSFFCKSDGSLDSGVEIVTVPLSLEEHRGSGRRPFDWRGIMRGILPIAMSGSKTSRCGMHVHVNRGALSNMVLAKMLLLMNDRAMQPLVSAIAQRGSSQWARPYQKTWGSWKDPTRDGRYQPLNCTRHTVEFRVFRGSLRYDRILKNLEFCDAVVHYCRDVSAAQFLDPDRLRAYLIANEKTWPVLAGFLREIGEVADVEVAA